MERIFSGENIFISNSLLLIKAFNDIVSPSTSIFLIFSINLHMLILYFISNFSILLISNILLYYHIQKFYYLKFQ